jgi:hypothetical protein
MRVDRHNIRFIRIFFLVFIVAALFFVNSMLPTTGDSVITGAVTADNRSPVQQSILISLSALLAILVVIIIVIVLFIRNERLLKHFFH